MLELAALSKRLGRFVLEDLSLEVRSGEYFVLQGPSGVGKTVLLEMIAGLLPPDAGRILWQGRDVTRVPPHRRRFVLMYQDYALFPHLSVAGNIGYGLAAGGLARNDSHRRVADVAGKLGIDHLLVRRVAALSGGEQQRVALARALVTRPEILLLDEPLAALDGNTRLRLRAELKQIQQQSRTTFVHVTHDLDEAMALGDRIGVMLNQRLHQVGSPVELFRSPSDYDVACFLGMRNVIRVTEAGAGTCRIGPAAIHAAGATPAVRYLWIKPEEVVLSRQPFDSSARNQFQGTVAGWEYRDGLLAVRLDCGALSLVALVTHASFEHLAIEAGKPLLATFKSSAVHCF